MAYEIANIFNFYKYVSFIANKQQTGAKLKVDNFNLLAPVVQWKGIKRKYCVPEEFQPGIPFSRQMYEWTQSNIDSMSRFKVALGLPDRTMPLPVDEFGYAELPSDYMHVSSIGYSLHVNTGYCLSAKSENIIEPLTDAEWNDRINDPIAPASTKYPICRFFFTPANNRYFLQIAPVGLKLINFNYLRKPTTPFLDFTLNELEPDGFIYNPTTSTQFEFAENDIIDLAPIMLEMIGVNIREQQLIQMADKFKKEGV
jgi:hypothetical protein